MKKSSASKQRSTEEPISRDVLETQVRERTRELERANEELKSEIAARAAVEKELRREETRLSVLLKLYQMLHSGEEEIIDFTLQSVAQLTESTMSYFLSINGDENSVFRSWFGRTCQNCNSGPGEGHCRVESEILSECLRTRRPVIQNDLAGLPRTSRLPQGHVPIHSHMNIPVLDGETVVAIIGVANKPEHYGTQDAHQLELLAQGMWSLLQRKRAESEMHEAQIDAERANSAKSEFLAHMSHEIRTPLNGVLGLTELLSNTTLSGKQREYVQLIRSSGKSLLSLINDILDFSKIETGKLELEETEFDFHALVESVLGILAARAADKGLELCLFVDPNVPSIVRGDLVRLRQVFLNLVSNAIKFTETGGVRIRINVLDLDEKSVFLHCSIVDTGIGITDDAMQRLFKSFSQGDASSIRKFGGTGLGLVISQRLVHLMRGSIGAESTLGAGSTFWFTLPLLLPEKALQSRQRPAPLFSRFSKEKNARFSLKGLRVLIVDDNPVQRGSLVEQLAAWDMDAVSVETQTEALGVLLGASRDSRPFQLIVIDATIAAEGKDGLADGLELVWKIKEHEPLHTIPMIFLIPLTADFDFAAVRQMGVNIHVGKPVYTSSLFDAVVTALFEDEFGYRNETKTGENALLPSPAPGQPAGSARILVAEDNRINQIVVRDILGQAGFECQIVGNGQLAVETLSQPHEFSAVLMDCQMPEMDGFEATKTIRTQEMARKAAGEKASHIPIIALTANATKGDEEKCLEAGMDAYCSKPIDPKKLIDTIESFLGRRAN